MPPLRSNQWTTLATRTRWSGIWRPVHGVAAADIKYLRDNPTVLVMHRRGADITELVAQPAPIRWPGVVARLTAVPLRDFA